MKKLTLLLCGLALVALPLAACGDDDDSETTVETTSTQSAGQTVDIAAAPDNSLAYEQKTLEAKGTSGEITFALNNPAQISHDFCIEDESGKELGCTDLVAEGESELEVGLNPGEYTFFCSVAGHRDGGMEGTLTVD